jgi:hypothetical protein
LLPLWSINAAEFLILSNPQNLSIYNQFEQVLSTPEKNLLLSFAPFEVVKRKELLGDQISEVLKGVYQGKTYFILKNENGNFSGNNASVYQKYIQGCTVLNDSVQLKRAISLSEKTTSGKITFQCKEGESITRVFQHNSSYYLLKRGKPGRYGWYSGSPDVFRKTKTIQKLEVSNTEEILPGVQSRLNSANQNYEQYFGYFNDLTQKQKSIPKWSLKREGQTIRCTLNSSQQINTELQSSTRYILQDIEQMLLGKPYIVTYNPGEITINPR